MPCRCLPNGQGSAQTGQIAHVSLDETPSANDGARLDVRLFDCAVVKPIEVVDNGDAMSAGYERIDEMAANETGPTSDEHMHAASRDACRSAWAGGADCRHPGAVCTTHVA